MKMSSNLYIIDFQNWSLSEKMTLFDQKDFSSLYSLKEEECHKFFKSIIVNTNENSYIRKQALQLYIDFALFGNLTSIRKIIAFLLDEISNNEDVFLLMCKLKNLWLFYDNEKEEIEQYYTLFTHCNSELIAESFMALGYIHAYKSSEATDELIFKSSLNEMRRCFSNAKGSIENRIDADCFLAFSDIWLSLNSDSPAIKITALKNILNEYRFDSLSSKDYILPYTIFRVLQGANELTQINISTWTDFKSEFNKMYLNWFNIRNQHIENEIKERGIITALKKNLETNYIEPYFRRSFIVEKIRLEQCILQVGEESDLGQFLKGILSLLPTDETQDITNVKKSLKQLVTYPISEKELDEIRTIEDAIKLLSKSNDKIEKEKVEFINNQIEHALLELQKNTVYFDAKEDERNTFIRSVLSSTLNLADQTFSGVSSSKSSAGEVDLLIMDFNHMPLSYIEAMNLTSVNKNYIAEHITKIFGYDLAGCPNNYIICYVKVADFASFWQKYVELIKIQDVGFTKVSDEAIDSRYSNYKRHVVTYSRNGKEIRLHHIAILIYNN